VNQAVGTNPKRSLSARISARFAASRLNASRRRVGTIAAVAFALLIAYHVVAGNNGWNIYQQKMAEDKALAAEVKELQKDNSRLQRHVDHLASDPDAIEFEAHQRLRYMMPGQVTVLNSGDEKTESSATGK
jgi:cell division protein FtsB